MRYQASAATCGAAAIVNALSALRHPVTEDEVLKASGVRNITQGLGTAAIKKALTALGYGHTVVWQSREIHGWLLLLDHLAQGEPVILAVDGDEHWVTAFGQLGPLVQVADGAHNDLVLSYDRAGLMKRWNSGSRRPYWGLAVSAPRRQ